MTVSILVAGVSRPTAEEAIMNGHTDNRSGTRQGAAAAPRTVAAGSRRVRIKKSSGRKLRDLPELDLRTPSGRLLPY